MSHYTLVHCKTIDVLSNTRIDCGDYLLKHFRCSVFRAEFQALMNNLSLIAQDVEQGVVGLVML